MHLHKQQLLPATSKLHSSNGRACCHVTYHSDCSASHHDCEQRLVMVQAHSERLNVGACERLSQPFTPLSGCACLRRTNLHGHLVKVIIM